MSQTIPSCSIQNLGPFKPNVCCVCFPFKKKSDLSNWVNWLEDATDQGTVIVKFNGYSKAWKDVCHTTLVAHLILVTCTTAKRYLNLAKKQHYIHPTHCKPIDSGCIAHKEINTDATRKKRRKQHFWTLGKCKYSELACLHLDHHFALRNSVNVVMKHAAITEATTCNAAWARQKSRVSDYWHAMHMKKAFVVQNPPPSI